MTPPRADRDRGSPRPGAGGFTLLEAMFASSILVVAVVAFCLAVASGQGQTVEMMRVARAQLLADALLEEVLSKAYADPDGGTPIGRDAGEASGNRAAFDDVDDYHGFAEPAGTLADAAGQPLPPEYAEFSRSVAVSTGTAPKPLSGTVAGKKIVIMVRGGEGQLWTVEHFVGAPQ